MKESVMEILPAIDLREGKCVRLLQGDYDRQIDYNDSPVNQALEFQRSGSKWLHVVDLDGARYGSHFNLPALLDIRKNTTLKIELGGGVRSEESVKTLLDSGIDRVIIGTKALEELEWFEKLVHDYPGKVVLGLDAKDGFIATHGWTETGKTTVLDMAKIVNNWPIAAIVYTDIACDGMLTGPNVQATKLLAENCKIPIIASGGVGDLEHIRQLAPLPLEGIIVGRALYENKFRLEEALEIVANR